MISIDFWYWVDLKWFAFVNNVNNWILSSRQKPFRWKSFKLTLTTIWDLWFYFSFFRSPLSLLLFLQNRAFSTMSKVIVCFDSNNKFCFFLYVFEGKTFKMVPNWRKKENAVSFMIFVDNWQLFRVHRMDSFTEFVRLVVSFFFSRVYFVCILDMSISNDSRFCSIYSVSTKSRYTEQEHNGQWKQISCD